MVIILINIININYQRVFALSIAALMASSGEFCQLMSNPLS